MWSSNFSKKHRFCIFDSNQKRKSLSLLWKVFRSSPVKPLLSPTSTVESGKCTSMSAVHKSLHQRYKNLPSRKTADEFYLIAPLWSGFSFEVDLDKIYFFFSMPSIVLLVYPTARAQHPWIDRWIAYFLPSKLIQNLVDKILLQNKAKRLILPKI